MAPALNEPLNQAQLPLSPASASSSPRPGILPSNGNGAAGAAAAELVQKPQPQHAITNRYNKPSSGTAAAAAAAATTKSTFQLAFIQQINSNTATNGPAATGPSNVQRHMDRKDPSSRTAAAKQQQQQQQQHQQLSPLPTIVSGQQHHPVASKSSPHQQHLLLQSTSTGVTSSTHDQHNITQQQHQHQQLLDDLGDGQDDDAALKSDVQDLVDLGLHLDEDLTESLCDTPPPISGSSLQHHNHLNNHQQQQQHYQQQHDHLELESPSHNNNTMGLPKNNPDMDQMLTHMLTCNNDMELLQVFKSLETCDMASTLGLFNEDVMNIGLDELQTPVKEPDTAEMRNEIKKRQTEMQRKCDFLLRRLRKLQTRSMAQHVDEEVQGLFDYTQKLLKRKERSISTMQSVPPAASLSDAATSITAESTALLLRRLDTAADEQQQVLPPPLSQQQQHHQQQQSHHAQRKAKDHATNATTTTTAAGGTVAVASLPGASVGGASAARVVPCFERAFSSQVALTAGHLQTELKIVGSALDSDATASSSGGDSGDEFTAYSKQQQTPQSSQSQHHNHAQFAANQSSATGSGKDVLPNIAKRAAARWSRDRATIASRWSWLLAQVSDLEYRIRQHSELHQQIKKTKGSVMFEDGLPNVAPAAQLLAAMASPDATVNGYRGLLPGNNSTTVHKADGDELVTPANAPSGSSGGFSGLGINNGNAFSDAAANCNAAGSCRTRAFQRSEFRKRKLLQTPNLHTVSKKAAKTSTLKCGCQWPLYPCALCTGRPDPTAPRDLPDMMSSSERVGLLDAGFHPVISFPSDIGQGIYIESTLRNIEFQTKVCRATSKSVMRSSLALQKAQKKEDRSNRKLFGGVNNASGATASGSAGNPGTGKKKYNVLANKLKKKAKKNNNSSGTNTPTASASSTPAHHQHHQYGGGGGSSTTSTSKHKKNHHYATGGSGDGSVAGPSGGSSSSAMTASQQHQSENFEYGPNGAMLPRSRNTSPTHGGQRSHHGTMFYASAASDRRSRGGGGGGGAYDIDNIVIPYSVAASTRVEILQCKEIPTPKWRTLLLDTKKEEASDPIDADEFAPPALVQPPDEPAEDVTADAILRRHENALAEERKKFATYLKFPWSTRSRANRRIDSRADSSGANTPDPTSPALPKTPGGGNTVSVGGEPEFAASPAGVSTPQHPPTVAVGGTPLEQIAEQPTSSDIIKPDTPAALSGTSNGSGGRRRTVSTKRTSDDHRNSSSSSNPNDQRDYVQPYEQREFPLSDEAFANLLQMMPAAHHDLIDRAIQQHQQQLQQNSPPATPQQQLQPPPQNSTAAGPSNASIMPAIVSVPSQLSDSPLNRSASSNNDAAAPPQSICKTEYDFERLIGAASVMGPISGVVGNPYGYGLAGLRETDEETESIESGMMDEDPNDPEWFDPSEL